MGEAKMEPDTITAMCAAVIALCAVGVSIWEGIQNRKHNRLTTRPNLRIDRFTYVGSRVRVTVTNNGVGPAFVKGFCVKCDNNRVNADDMPLAAAAAKRLKITNLVDTYTPEIGDSFSVGESKDLLVVCDAPDDSTSRKDLRRELKRIEFDIIYESIYGETFTTERYT